VSFSGSIGGNVLRAAGLARLLGPGSRVTRGIVQQATFATTSAGAPSAGALFDVVSGDPDDGVNGAVLVVRDVTFEPAPGFVTAAIATSVSGATFADVELRQVDGASLFGAGQPPFGQPADLQRALAIAVSGTLSAPITGTDVFVDAADGTLPTGYTLVSPTDLARAAFWQATALAAEPWSIEEGTPTLGR
jgi:hypothetical protein